MRIRFVILKITLLLVMVFSTECISQPDSTQTPLERIELQDGTVLIGTVLSETESIIQFRTRSDIEVTIPKAKITARLKVKEKQSAPIAETNDPNATRLLFAPTGKALQKGQGYFSVYQIFFPFVAVGLSNYFTMAGGFSLIPGTSDQLVYVAPKLTPLQTKNFDLSAGVLYVKVPDESAGGIFYGVGTLSGRKNTLTVGIGYGFSESDFASKPILMIGGELQLSNSIKLISENWIITGDTLVPVSLGIRFFGEKIAADFALINLLSNNDDDDGLPFFPWIGFAYNFGK